jgi:hypothetical protein
MMTAAIAAVAAAVVSGVVGYILGNLRLKYEHLLERRAEVLAKLSELLAAVNRDVTAFSSPYQLGGVNRSEQREEASQSFAEFTRYYRANEVWLEPKTCDSLDKFVKTVADRLVAYAADLDERGHPTTKEGRDLALSISQDTEPLRQGLISEFRQILYPPRWRDYLRVLGQRENSPEAHR